MNITINHNGKPHSTISYEPAKTRVVKRIQPRDSYGQYDSWNVKLLTKAAPSNLTLLVAKVLLGLGLILVLAAIIKMQSPRLDRVNAHQCAVTGYQADCQTPLKGK